MNLFWRSWQSAWSLRFTDPYSDWWHNQRHADGIPSPHFFRLLFSRKWISCWEDRWGYVFPVSKMMGLVVYFLKCRNDFTGRIEFWQNPVPSWNAYFVSFFDSRICSLVNSSTFMGSLIPQQSIFYLLWVRWIDWKWPMMTPRILEYDRENGKEEASNSAVVLFNITMKYFWASYCSLVLKEN